MVMAYELSLLPRSNMQQRNLHSGYSRQIMRCSDAHFRYLMSHKQQLRQPPSPAPHPSPSILGPHLLRPEPQPPTRAPQPPDLLTCNSVAPLS